MRDLVPFGQSKQREKHPWRRVTVSKIEGSSDKFVQMVPNRAKHLIMYFQKQSFSDVIQNRCS